MAEKRKRDDNNAEVDNTKKAKRGFTVGPQNLPDGTYRRKTQKIKAGLIQRAQIKQSYAKLKKQGKYQDEERSVPEQVSADVEDRSPAHVPSTAPHPDRQSLIHLEREVPLVSGENKDVNARPRVRRPKHVPFQREYAQAQQRQEEAEVRRRAREDAERERQRRIIDREKFRKAMSKARSGGVNGQRKLGRESKVLLEKVKRMIDEG